MDTIRIAALLNDAAIRPVFINRNNNGTLSIGCNSSLYSVSVLVRATRILHVHGYNANWNGRYIVVKDSSV